MVKKENDPGSEAPTVATFLERLIQAAQEMAQKETMPQDEALKKKLKEYLEAQQRLEAQKKVELLEAKQFDRKIKTSNERQATRIKARTDTYAEQQVHNAPEVFQATRAALAEVGGSVPAWIEPAVTQDAIQGNPALAEYATRIALLHPDLQNNPAVVRRELTRLYYSTDWLSLSDRGVEETRRAIQSSLDHIAQQAPSEALPQDKFYKLIDGRIDIYRTNRPDMVDKPGEPPFQHDGKVDRKDPQYFVWREEVERYAQHQALEEQLSLTQAELDRFEGDVKSQNQMLGELARDLREGYKKTRLTYEWASMNPRGEVYTDKIGIDKKYSEPEARAYMDYAQRRSIEWSEAVQTNSEQERNSRNIIDARERAVDEGQAVIWTEHDTQVFGNDTHKEGDFIRINRRGLVDKEFIDRMRKCNSRQEAEDFQRQWLAVYRDEVVSPHKAYHLDLNEQQVLTEHLEVFKFFWGGIENNNMPKYLRELSDGFEEFDNFYHAIFDRPAGKKVEDFTQYIRYITSNRIETLRQTEHFEIAKPLYNEATIYVLDADHQVYFDALEEILGHVNVNDNYEIVQQGGRRITRNDLEKQLKKMYEHNNSQATRPLGDLTEEQYILMKQLQVKVDLVGQGVILRDKHMTPGNTETHQYLVSHQKEYLEIAKRISQGNISADELQQLQKQQAKLNKEFQEKCLDSYTLGYTTLAIDDAHTLAAVRNLSPVEMIVRERMIDTLLGEGKTIEQIYANEWKLYEAIWAARLVALGRGEIMQISGNMAQSSSLDLIYLLGRKSRPEYFMERSFAEPWTRVLNGHLFADDFQMGNRVGDDIRNLYYSNVFEISGYNWKDVMDRNAPIEWQNRRAQLMAHGAPQWVLMAEYAKAVLGLSYSEVVRPDLLACGLQTLSTTWRFKRDTLDPLRTHFLRQASDLPEGFVPDNEAMGYLYHVASDEGKRIMIHRLLERKTSVFIDLIGRELRDVIAPSGMKLGSKEWVTFKRALSVAEMRLWKDETLLHKKFNFADRADFDSIMGDAIRACGGDATPDRMNSYYIAIVRTHEYMNGTSVNGKSRIDNWNKHSFGSKINLCASDFNWKKVNMMAVNAFSLQRRINDFEAQAMAGMLMRDILHGHPEQFFFPQAGKELEAIQKIKEFRDKIVDYAGDDTAEIAQTAIFESMIDWNRNRAIYTPAGWIPGAVSLLRRWRGLNQGEVSNRETIRDTLMGFGPTRRFLESHHLDHALEHWIEGGELPKTLGQLAWYDVSYDVKWGGAESNAWDEYKIGGIFTTTEDLKMFRTTKGEAQLRRLQRKYRTGGAWRMFYGVPRKYWWVVPTATAFIALSAAVDDEKKNEGHH